MIGISEPQLGFKPINLSEKYYDYQVGDEFRFRELSNTMTYGVENKTIYRYTSRVDFVDSIVYQYEWAKNTITRQLSDISTYVSGGTSKQKIIKGTFFNTEPNEPYINDAGLISKVVVINSTIPQVFFWDFYDVFWNSNTNCFSQFGISDACYLAPTSYYLGLGVFSYYNCCELFMYNTNCEGLVYYKKGDITYGTPLVLETSVSQVNEENFNVFFYNNNINISSLTNDNIEVSIYNVSGLLLYNNKFSEQNITIPVSFPKGMYLIKIIGNHKNLVKQIVI